MRPQLATLLGLAAFGAASVAFTTPAQAKCYPGGSTVPDTSSTNCTVFNAEAPSNEALFQVGGLGGKKWLQLGFGSSGNTSASLWPILDVAVHVLRGATNTTYNIGNTFASPVDTPPTTNLFMAGGPISLATILGVGINNPAAAFRNSDIVTFSYKLPLTADGLNTGDEIFARALFNANGALLCTSCDYDGDHDVLNSVATGSPIIGDEESATHTRVPGPLPLLGAAAAFSASRRLRRRISLAA